MSTPQESRCLKGAILYHPNSRRAIYCPVGTPYKTIVGPYALLPPGITPVRSFLLMIHPVTRLQWLYLREGWSVEFKKWLMARMPEPQTAILPRPDEVIRSEYFERDIHAELSLRSSITMPSVSGVEVCLTSRALIRRTYYEDYRLGEYD